MTAEQAGSSDLFFYYDTVPIEDLVAADVFGLCLQTVGGLAYDRKYGSDLQMLEGAPNALSQQIAMRSSIMAGMALRNGRVTDGRNSYPDRRVVTSWNAVDIKWDGAAVDITVQYIAMADLTNLRTSPAGVQ